MHQLNSDGSLGTWTRTASNSLSLRLRDNGDETVAYQGTLSALGGCSSWNGSFQMYWLQLHYLLRYINNGGPGTTGTWTTAANHANAHRNGAVLALNGYLYTLLRWMYESGVGDHLHLVGNQRVAYAAINSDGAWGVGRHWWTKGD